MIVRRGKERSRSPYVSAAIAALCASAAFAAPHVAAAGNSSTANAAGGPHAGASSAAPVQPPTRSQLALRTCSQNADFLDIAGQGSICATGDAWVMRLGTGKKVTISTPDRISALLLGSHMAPAPAAALQSQQCVDPTQHTHVELYYAHFSGQPDNYASHVADIQQMFRDVDQNFLNYDAGTYFGVGIHLYAECDANGNPVVHDIALSTTLSNSTFDTVVTDMTRQGHNNNLAHYWIWTDGNPEAAYGYAGQSTIEDDDSASPNNAINSSYEFSINYGYTEANGGSQIFAHENGHAMGAVQLSAPHTTGAWHCTDGLDVMCYDDSGPRGGNYSSSVCRAAPNGTLLFDCNFDDYFNPAPGPTSYLASHWNLASANNHWLYVVPAGSSTSMHASSTSAVYSQPVTLTATVVPSGSPHPGTPGGAVSFYDGSSLLGTTSLNSSGIATLSAAALALGSHQLSATYNGSSVFAASTVSTPTTVSVSQAQSATSLSTSANPAPLGANLTVTAAVAPVAPATASPTGQVTFYADGNQVGAASLDSSGRASISISLGLGSHQLYASYGGDTNFTGSNDSTTQYQEVVLYPTNQTLRSSAGNNTTEYSVRVTFTSTVDAGAGTPGDQGPPTGSVTFEDGSHPLGAAVPLSGDTASFSTSTLSPGTHLIRAVYSGDASYAPNVSTLTETVKTWTSMYELDAFGGLHAVASGSLSSYGSLWSWPIARGLVLRSGGTSGYILDGWGGIHPFGGAPAVSGLTGYWPGWDIARGIVLRSDGHSGYVLDGWGGIHPFGGAPAVRVSAFWSRWDIAKGIVLRGDGQSGYVLDGLGGLHPFGAPGDIPATPRVSAYWSSWDIARGAVLDPDGQGGYVLDGWGGVHPFGNAPGVAVSAYWGGWDIAKSIVLMPGTLHMGYVLDGWGGLHPFGGAPSVPVPAGEWTPGLAGARDITDS